MKYLHLLRDLFDAFITWRTRFDDEFKAEKAKREEEQRPKPYIPPLNERTDDDRD